MYEWKHGSKWTQTIRPFYIYFPTIPEPVNNNIGDLLISSTKQRCRKSHFVSPISNPFAANRRQSDRSVFQFIAKESTTFTSHARLVAIHLPAPLFAAEKCPRSDSIHEPRLMVRGENVFCRRGRSRAEKGNKLLINPRRGISPRWQLLSPACPNRIMPTADYILRGYPFSAQPRFMHFSPLKCTDQGRPRCAGFSQRPGLTHGSRIPMKYEFIAAR